MFVIVSRIEVIDAASPQPRRLLLALDQRQERTSLTLDAPAGVKVEICGAERSKFYLDAVG